MGTIKRGFANNILTTGKFDATDLSGTIPSSNVANTTLSSITSVPASVGDLVQSVASDPSPAAAGDIWYNSTSGTFKAAQFIPDAWAAGGNLGSGRYGLSGFGTQTAAVACGGYNAGGYPVASILTENYNGTSWSPSGNLSSGRIDGAALGTQTAGLFCGGYFEGNRPIATEKYNGTSWTNSTNLPGIRQGGAGAGTQTASLVFGGFGAANPTDILSSALKFDGTTWTSTGSLSTGRPQLSGMGTQTAALAAGGEPSIASTEEFDGSTWTAGGNLNRGRALMSSAGTQTAGLVAGGGGSPQTETELYNGTSWTVSPATTANNQFYGGGCGTQPAAVVFGGGAGTTFRSQTEEFTGGALTVKTITTS